MRLQISRRAKMLFFFSLVSLVNIVLFQNCQQSGADLGGSYSNPNSPSSPSTLLSKIGFPMETQVAAAKKFGPVDQGIEITARGPFVEAHRRGSYYASWPSSFVEGRQLHTFYCSSMKPFSPGEGLEIGIAEKNSFYGSDVIRYESFDPKTLATLGISRTFISPALETKPNQNFETVKAIQAPCASSTVLFKGTYYTFFESFSESEAGGHLVAIHVARSSKLGGPAEILTTEGWQSSRNIRSPWKPVIQSLSVDNTSLYAERIRDGQKMARDNWGPETMGNIFWGVGAPSAVVKNDKIYLTAVDGFANPENCLYEKTKEGKWSPSASSRCSRAVYFSSQDAVGFSRLSVPAEVPAGDLKIVKDKGSPYDGYFAVFSRELDEGLKLKKQVRWVVSFGSSDLQKWTNKFYLADFPARVEPNNYSLLSGVVSFRIVGNEKGEISPFSDQTLLQVSLPRTVAQSNSSSPNENIDIHAWSFRFRHLKEDSSPLVIADSMQGEDPLVVPNLLKYHLVDSGPAEKQGVHFCGTSFARKTQAKVQWSEANGATTYYPEVPDATLKAVHYVSNERDAATDHPLFCLRIPLKPEEWQSLRSGKSAKAWLYQPLTTKSSAIINISGSAPKITYPIAGEPTDRQPTFSWSAGDEVSYFIVDLSEDPQFSWSWSQNVIGLARSLDYSNDGWEKKNTKTDAPEKLASGKTYFVRIRTFDGKWTPLNESAPVSFDVQSSPEKLAVKVEITKPGNNAVRVKYLPKFGWKASGSVGGFIVDISEDANFSWFWNRRVESGARDLPYGDGGWNPVNTANQAPQKLEGRKTYYIRVAALDEQGNLVMTSSQVKFKVK
ncbi:MAG: hypothetical protein RJB66_2308 [Pseudomonadota bacterium]